MSAGSDTDAWVRVVDLDDIWVGEFVSAHVEGEDLIIVHLEGGHVGAFLAACPHQGTSLTTGYLEGETLVCPAHLWEFDVRSGEGINPSTSCLVSRPVRVKDDAVWIGRRELNATDDQKGSETSGH